MAILMYSLDRIQVSETRRPIVEATVALLVESINSIGLLHPITVQKIDDVIWLVAGRNRLEAFKRIGTRDKIQATLIDVGVRLAELDENLVRGALSPIEEARALAERQQLYEVEHPETRPVRVRGGPGRGKKNDGQNGHGLSHAEAAATATGQSDRTIRRKVEAGEVLDDHLFDAAIGTTLDKPDEIYALTKLKEEAPEIIEGLVTKAAAGEKVSAKAALKKVKRAKKEAELGAKIQALPDKRYGVIVADPEWQWEPWSRETGMDRSAANHYPTSILPVIAARDVPSISADDCVLFLWATIPMLPHAFVVMAAWGFDYKSHYAWGKDRAGTGYWSREKHEILLIGMRGNVPCPAPGEQWDSLIIAPRGKHSAKPDCFLEMIEQYYPNVPKIELNARTARPGWDAWGNEIEVAA